MITRKHFSNITRSTNLLDLIHLKPIESTLKGGVNRCSANPIPNDAELKLNY